MTTTTGLTLEEFLALPETKPGSEFVDGAVVQKTMPTFTHGVIQRLLSFVFTLFLREHPVGDGGSEIRCLFGPPGHEQARLPDFAFVARERLAGVPRNGPFPGAPDLAVEILSPDDRMLDVLDKVRFYLDNGVRLVWLIDPRARTVMVWRSPAGAELLREQDTLDGGDVIPGFAVAVREVLPPPDNAESPEPPRGQLGADDGVASAEG